MSKISAVVWSDLWDGTSSSEQDMVSCRVLVTSTVVVNGAGQEQVAILTTVVVETSLIVVSLDGLIVCHVAVASFQIYLSVTVLVRSNVIVMVGMSDGIQVSVQKAVRNPAGEIGTIVFVAIPTIRL